jgi:nucleotide-binding universal stress UspA family protein
MVWFSHAGFVAMQRITQAICRRLAGKKILLIAAVTSAYSDVSSRRKERSMKILLAVDGSDMSLDAVRFAIRMALAGLHCEMVLANVQEAANLYELIVAHNPEVLERVSAEAGLHALQAAQALLDAAEVDYECEVAQGDPAHTLIDIAERFACDLIVMGARGQSALRRAMMGSVSNEVLHASAVPVVIVKPDLPPEDLAD